MFMPQVSDFVWYVFNHDDELQIGVFGGDKINSPNELIPIEIVEIDGIAFRHHNGKLIPFLVYTIQEKETK
jgi:hypothetical protein